MFWARFEENMHTELIAVNEDSESAHKKVTDMIIHDLYEIQLSLLLWDENIFMHDRASVHQAIIVKELLIQLEIEIMNWSFYSIRDFI